MNIEETKKAIEVMQAFVDGKTVQVSAAAGWESTPTPCWSWDICEYRIKPAEPKNIWVNEYKNFTYLHESAEDANKNAGPTAVRKAVHYREVIEE